MPFTEQTTVREQFPDYILSLVALHVSPKNPWKIFNVKYDVNNT